MLNVGIWDLQWGEERCDILHFQIKNSFLKITERKKNGTYI